MDTSSNIGSRIAHLRAVNDETQQFLADSIDVKRETVKFWESGNRHIKDDDIIKLAKHFGVSADYLLGLSNVESPDIDLQAISKITGLNEASISNITKSREFHEGWNDLLSLERMPLLILFLLDLKTCTERAMDFLKKDNTSFSGNDLLELENLRKDLEYSFFQLNDFFRTIISNNYDIDAFRENLAQKYLQIVATREDLSEFTNLKYKE